jgi:hypothetical protein
MPRLGSVETLFFRVISPGPVCPSFPAQGRWLEQSLHLLAIGAWQAFTRISISISIPHFHPFPPRPTPHEQTPMPMRSPCHCPCSCLLVLVLQPSSFHAICHTNAERPKTAATTPPTRPACTCPNTVRYPLGSASQVSRPPDHHLWVPSPLRISMFPRHPAASPEFCLSCL